MSSGPYSFELFNLTSIPIHCELPFMHERKLYRGKRSFIAKEALTLPGRELPWNHRVEAALSTLVSGVT